MAGATDHDARDWLGRLLVVRSCGYLEQTVLYSCLGYIEGRDKSPLGSFAASHFAQSRNPKQSYLLEVVGRFNPGWSSDLEDFLNADDESLGRDLAYMVDRRHKIAHGTNEGVRPTRALELKSSACQIADWFIAQFNPDRT